MAAAIRTPRTSWIGEGLRALAVRGPDSVRIEKPCAGAWRHQGRLAAGASGLLVSALLTALLAVRVLAEQLRAGHA